MPSPDCIWLVSSPLSPSADASEMLHDLRVKLDPSLIDAASTASAAELSKNVVKKATGRSLATVSRVDWGDFKTGTLSSLLALADTLSKHDTVFQGVVDKIVDTIRSLTSADEDPSILEKHLLTEDGQPYLSPLTASSTSHAYSSSSSSSSDEPGWHWNRAKYRVEGRALSDVVDALARDMQSLDTIHKQKVSAYNAAKGQLAVLQRKQTGNLATKDLSSVLTSPPSSEDVSSSSSSTTPLSLSNSEYLEITYVAVPKNSIKDFEAKYERLASMVVPRSAVRLAQDEEYALYSVTIFKRVRDEFNQKCREDKFIVRDFTYDRASMEKQRHEFDELQASEKDLWTDLLRISRINFAEAFSLVIHLKVVASYVECVLRYGLPADYFICAVSPDGKNAKKALSTLSSYFETFTPDVNSSTARRVGGSGSDGKKNKNRSKVGSSSSSAAIDENALVGEFQNLLEQEVFEFVLQEVPTYTSANADSR